MTIVEELEYIKEALKTIKNQEWLKGFEYCTEKVFDITAKPKTQTAWVIMKGSRFFALDSIFDCGFYINIYNADLFANNEECVEIIKDYKLKNCKPVKIIISVEED